MEFNEVLKIFLWSMTPVGELRISIPLGIITYKINPFFVYIVSVAGNIFIILLIYFFLNLLTKHFFTKIYFINHFLNRLFAETKNNHYKKIEKYGVYFLPFFVAIPLPVTGAWTASLISFVFGVPLRKAFPLISFGVLIAGILVLFITEAGIAFEKYFGWQGLAGVIISVLLIYLFYNKKAKNI